MSSNSSEGSGSEASSGNALSRKDFLLELLKQEKDNIRNSCNVVLAWFAFSIGANGTAISQLQAKDRPNYMILMVLILIVTNFTGGYFCWRVGVHVNRSIKKLRDMVRELSGVHGNDTYLWSIVEPSSLYSLWARVIYGFSLAKVSMALAWCAATVVVTFSEHYGVHISLNRLGDSPMQQLIKTGSFEIQPESIRDHVKLSSADRDTSDQYVLTAMGPIVPPQATATETDTASVDSKTPCTESSTTDDKIKIEFSADPEMADTLKKLGAVGETAARTHAKTSIMIMFLGFSGVVFLAATTAIVLAGVVLASNDERTLLQQAQLQDTQTKVRKQDAKILAERQKRLAKFSFAFLCVVTALCLVVAGIAKLLIDWF